MKVQNTTSNTPVSLVTTITPIATTSMLSVLPKVAANEQCFDAVAHGLGRADEIAYWMIVATAFAFQLLLVNLVSAL